jgi:hypothetical protein
MKIWALRCASADRLDLFPAQLVRRPDGEVEVRGGNVRDPYKPAEVWFVTKAGLSEVKGVVRETEQALRRLMRADDIAFAIARDGVTRSMTHRLHGVCKRCCEPLTGYIERNGV